MAKVADLAEQLQAVKALEFENAGAYVQAVEELAGQLAEAGPELRIQVQSELGNAMRVVGDFDRASELLREAIDEAEAELPEGPERHALLALAHLRLAIVHDLTGALVPGFRHIDAATRHYRESGDQAGQARCDMVRAALYMRIEDYAESEDCYRRALEYYRQDGDSERIGVALTNLCNILRFQDRSEEAVAVGREALEYAGSKLLRMTAKGNLASALGDLGQLDEALAMHLETQEAIMGIGHPNYVITYQRSVATILTGLGRAAEARDMLQEALALAEEHGLERDASEVHGLLAGAYAELGEFELAYRHQSRYLRERAEQQRQTAAERLEVHKWLLQVEAAQQQAEAERARRKALSASLEEMTDLHEQLTARAAALEWSSYRDSLTELANRRYFDQRLGDFTKRSRESGEDVGVLVLDMDRFKSINDEYGHPVGDEVLRATARLLEAGTRRTDVPARMGGEEFAVLLSGVTDPEQLHARAKELRLAFESHDWSGIAPDLHATVSIGAALLSEVDGHPFRLLELADRRLYAAKRAGRNKVVSAGELD